MAFVCDACIEWILADALYAYSMVLGTPAQWEQEFSDWNVTWGRHKKNKEQPEGWFSGYATSFCLVHAVSITNNEPDNSHLSKRILNPSNEQQISHWLIKFWQFRAYPNIPVSWAIFLVPFLKARMENIRTKTLPCPLSRCCLGYNKIRKLEKKFIGRIIKLISHCHINSGISGVITVIWTKLPMPSCVIVRRQHGLYSFSPTRTTSSA